MKKVHCEKTYIWKNSSGWCAIGWTETGASFFKFGHKTRESLEKYLLENTIPIFTVIWNTGDLPKHISKTMKHIDSFFEGRKTVFNCPLDWRRTTDFQQAVWSATAAIPFGETATYAEVAAAAGSPGGARAAGNALNSNPLPVIIPCHRVLPASGGIGGFATGSHVKKMLLDLEAGI